MSSYDARDLERALVCGLQTATYISGREELSEGIADLTQQQLLCAHDVATLQWSRPVRLEWWQKNGVWVLPQTERTHDDTHVPCPMLHKVSRQCAVHTDAEGLLPVQPSHGKGIRARIPLQLPAVGQV
jgi:hypothetical protein